ncbi:response regulator transcription factor [Rhodoferax sp. GW822-FHT02A01]|uniref:response regulator transcription factor n=1 Tax=Rhodoferax sp. GW822-FHT02A01 TaxID=3141537 RepID=UPI00315D3EB1
MHARRQILIVDDDTEITALLADFLVRYGYTAHVANDGVEMFRQLGAHAIDLIVLDAMLPGADGMSLVRDMRRHSRIPIIMLTARSSAYDRILGLESGADDYMGKPFEPRELVSRIQSVLRRSFVAKETPAASVGNSVICFDGWELHCDNRCLYSPEGLVVALSEAEFRLMCTFLHNPQQLFQRAQLLKLAREGSTDTIGRSIDLLVSRLRQKLACMPDGQNMIKTVRGGGYMFNVRSVLDRTQSRQHQRIAGLSGH